MTSLTWQSALGNEKQKEYFVELLERVKQAREAGSVIYPPQPDVFNALKYTPLDKVNVVILGQILITALIKPTAFVFLFKQV